MQRTTLFVMKSFTTLATFAVLLAGASNAAADAKVFPGTMCVQRGSGSSVTYNGDGRVLNSTRRRLTVICPIVRDITTRKWDRVEVVVGDRSRSDDISCTAISAQADGLHGGFNPETQESVGFHPNWWQSQTLRFGRQSQERDNGTYFLSCTIPARYEDFDPSGIYSYRIIE